MAGYVTVSVEVAGTGTPAAPAVSELPRTGADVETLVALAVLLILLGALLVRSVMHNERTHRCATD